MGEDPKNTNPREQVQVVLDYDEDKAFQEEFDQFSNFYYLHQPSHPLSH